MALRLVQTSRRVCESRGRYIAEPSPDIPSEKAFSHLWERSLELRPELVGRDGETYEILFPGVRNQGAGPDFKGAVLKRDGKTIGGDVELHLDSSGWRSHGHHGDSRYHGVVLQVVLKAPAGRGDAPMPPTAEAKFELVDDILPNKSQPREAPDLEDLGVRRFHAKSAGFRLELKTASNPDQVLYASLLESMGYARNRKPFRALASHVSYDVFSILSEEPSSAAAFAVFSSLAVGGGLTADLEERERVQVRRVARMMGVRSGVSTKSWSRFRVRPSNSPMSRMRGIAPFLSRSHSSGLGNTLRALFDQEGVPGLIRAIECQPFIGRGFAITVVANIIVPALHAASLSRGAGEPDRLVEAFREMPSPPQDAVTRGVSSVLGLDVRPNLAVEHFGLHALARSKSWPGSEESAA